MGNEILDCGHPPTKTDDCGTGYGISSETGKTSCYACCAEVDRKQMRNEPRITLYLLRDEKGYKVTNWPGSLTIRLQGVSTGRHNIARTRQDVWFPFEGTWWHGVQYGEFTQLLHCRKLKHAPR